ncbi:sigma-54-dependent Fis family transcriptional regulator, partial [Diaphorobacter ruginosibacter]|uniref:sigma-54-dependent Fis family transcriptional regulator n=1 Tax=Diaphorobacter ruginosibacter TaxID=1715720 RepID=UPI00334093A6
MRQARQHLLEYGQCPSGVLDERVARSWSRSLAAGLDPTARPHAAEHASGGALRQALSSHPLLLAHSRPVMEYLFEQVRHSQSVVVLADQRGMLMHTLGDPQFVDKAERVALTSGASWHEDHRGTNAIGTALAERGPVEVHGGEHFLERNGFLTCAAAPIFSGTGELQGILDISGDSRNGHAHTLGLVSTAARMIENSLLIATSERGGIRLHLHAHPEGLGGIAEGIVTVSGDGWIVGANRAGLALLGLRTGDLGATLLERVLDVRLEQLLSEHRRRPRQPQALRLASGALVFARIWLDSALWPAPGARAAPTAVSSAAPGPDGSASAAPQDALARLETGDARWRAAADKARRVADKPIPLLILGESGVGKDLFARAVHASGPRAQGPFVAVNCGAIPESLIEAELFGYVAGAFTGARKEGSTGRLREAHGGTLFLDEIGDMPLAMQTRLLRVLQERRVTPVGAGKAIAVDFSLICATHSPLQLAAGQGRFRQDLYYRINGLTLQLPALRERTDFLAITGRLLAEQARELARARPLDIAPGLLARLAAHDWPGNLRQYASALRTACAMLREHEDTVDWEHLPDDLAQALTTERAAPTTRAAGCSQIRVPPAAMSLEQISSAAIEQALQSTHGNISQAARQ